MAHKHATLMAQYARDAAETDRPWERWEILRGDSWCDLTENPTWIEYMEYRRKGNVYRIGGIEIPTPLREEPTEGCRYYYIRCRRPASSLVNEFSISYTNWHGTFDDFRRLWSNICHLSEEAATAHANALNSLLGEHSK